MDAITLMKNDINRLLYLRRELDQIIENFITEDVVRGKDVDIDRIRESLIYHIDDNLDALRQRR